MRAPGPRERVPARVPFASLVLIRWLFHPKSIKTVVVALPISRLAALAASKTEMSNAKRKTTFERSCGPGDPFALTTVPKELRAARAAFHLQPNAPWRLSPNMRLVQVKGSDAEKTARDPHFLSVLSMLLE